MRKLEMPELNRLSVDEFRTTDKTPLIVVLENVRSALNVGSAFRTADAFALQKVVLVGFTATPPHREILKTALGSTETVEWAHFDDIESAIAATRAAATGGGTKIFAVEQTEGSVSLEKIEISKNESIALIFGNEVDGVSDEALARVDGVLEVPQFGTKHSLNVAVTVGIVTWELTKKIRF